MNFLTWLPCTNNLLIFSNFFNSLLIVIFCPLFGFVFSHLFLSEIYRTKKIKFYLFKFIFLGFVITYILALLIPTISNISYIISENLFPVEKTYINWNTGWEFSVEELQAINSKYVCCFLLGIPIFSYFYFLIVKGIKLKNKTIKYIVYAVLLALIIVIFFFGQSFIMNNIDSFWTCSNM